MAAPKRAAAEDVAADEVIVTSARRALDPKPSKAGLTRYVIAPLAVLSVGAMAATMLMPQSAEPLEAEAAAEAPSLGTSRNQSRPTLTPSVQPTQEPFDTAAATAADPVAPTVSPSPAKSPAPALASETPTAVPSPEQSSAISAEAPAGVVAGVAGAVSAGSAEGEAPGVGEAEVAVEYELGELAGTLFAAAPVNVRTGPGTGFDVVTSLTESDEVEVTAVEVDGWQQVALDDEAGWIKATYLTEEEPAGFSTAVCASAQSLERNLTERTSAVLRAVCAEFPRVTSYGGYRPGDNDSYHGSGRAIDVMVSGEYGWEIARWARENAAELGITEVIYEQKIWTSQRGGEGWRGMSNRGSVSANHYDHVHISVR